MVSKGLIVLSCFLALSGAKPVLAQTKVCGLFVSAFKAVENGKQKSVAGAVVQVQALNRSKSVLAKPSLQKFYLAKSLARGHYLVTVAKDGYRTSQQTLEFNCEGAALTTEIEVKTGRPKNVLRSKVVAKDLVLSVGGSDK